MVCTVQKGLKELDWLFDLPLAFMGYSFGAALAYECARTLEHEWGVSVNHLICLNGPDRERLRSWTFMNSATDRDIDKFIAYHVANMGRFNPLFDMNTVYLPDLLGLIFEVFFRDNDTALNWIEHYDNLPLEQRQVKCHITCINGDVDMAVRHGGWMDLAQGSYEQITFPGK